MFVCLSLHAGKISSALGGQGGFSEPPSKFGGSGDSTEREVEALCITIRVGPPIPARGSNSCPKANQI